LGVKVDPNDGDVSPLGGFGERGEGSGDGALSEEPLDDAVAVGEVVLQPKKEPSLPGDLGLEVEDESNDSSE
jgi:hypothetical protein